MEIRPFILLTEDYSYPRRGPERTELVFELPEEVELLNEVFRAAHSNRNNFLSLDRQLSRHVAEGRLVVMGTVDERRIQLARERQYKLKRMSEVSCAQTVAVNPAFL